MAHSHSVIDRAQGRLDEDTASIECRIILELSNQVQRVAKAMQAGDDDRAATEARVAARIARRLMP